MSSSVAEVDPKRGDMGSASAEVPKARAVAMWVRPGVASDQAMFVGVGGGR